MNWTDVPVLRAVFRVGPADRVFDLLILFGPLLITSIALVGRNPITTGLTVLYLCGFAGYVLYKGLRGQV
ncbi:MULTISPECIES: hypothetical protein [Halorussus]|uniref:hypothetical protein n=1 Tax=Halorussus TaxID=1070314 RepID=UPI000E20EC82|nr:MULTISPECIES: hypothetical protein [Halorussus]NHN61371.1 hypothetical protein [Halorussus sp. JP-T4]